MQKAIRRPNDVYKGLFYREQVLGVDLEPEDNCKGVEFHPPGGARQQWKLHTEMNEAGPVSCPIGGAFTQGFLFIDFLALLQSWGLYL
ncbi:hypothetical protein CHARACLAT_014345 [Characodon lateralis]|uniref:Ricin B lectin domain-containing protein n=1 Tax=Characodon lateralis TaxID=208331 RepID=A0ABU7D6T0_9TELE|nr:hypothetical protein [Characodon lateralis]